MKTRTHSYVEVSGVECETQYAGIDGTELTEEVNGQIVVAYLVYDEGYEDDCDCMGELLSFHRRSKDIERGLEALGRTLDFEPDLDAVWVNHESVATQRYIKIVSQFDGIYEDLKPDFDQDEGESDEEFIKSALALDCEDAWSWEDVRDEDAMRAVLTEMWDDPEYHPGDKDAQLLAVYSHSGEHWSLSGEGMQCRWDTSNRAGTWVPDDCLRSQLDDDEKAGKDRQAQARIYAQQFLDNYNEVNSGQVYGCVVETFDMDGERLEEDACWGYVGFQYAQECLKDEYFAHACKKATEGDLLEEQE